MASLTTPENRLKFAKFLIKFKQLGFDNIHTEFKLSDESCPQALLDAIENCDQLYGERYPFKTLISDSQETFDEYFHSLSNIITKLFLKYLTVKPSVEKPGDFDIDFNIKDAEAYWHRQLEILKPQEPLKRRYDDPHHYGVLKKSLNSICNVRYQLERDHLLNDNDIILALETLELKDSVFVSPFSSDAIAGRLHFERQRQNNQPYDVYGILNYGNNHWIRVKISLNPQDKTVLIIYRDSLAECNSKINDKNNIIHDRLKRSIDKTYPETFRNENITIRCLGPEEIRQPKDNQWVCGYLALLATAKEIRGTKVLESKSDASDAKTTPQDTSLNKVFCEWDGKEADDLRNLVFRLVLTAAKVDRNDYNKVPERLKSVCFRESKDTPVIKLSETAIDTVLDQMQYNDTRSVLGILKERGLLLDQDNKQPAYGLGLESGEQERASTLPEGKYQQSSFTTEAAARQLIEKMINNKRYWQTKVHYKIKTAVPTGIEKLQRESKHNAASNSININTFSNYQKIVLSRAPGERSCLSMLASCFFTYANGGRDPIVDDFYLAFKKSKSFTEMLNQDAVQIIIFKMGLQEFDTDLSGFTHLAQSRIARAKTMKSA